MTKFKLGLIGAGLITETAHLPAIIKCEKVEIKTVVDTNIERALYIKNKFKLNCSIHTEIDQYKGSLDGVLITTPNNSHYSITLTCIEKGINVLVEKPLATTLSNANEMIETAKRKQRVLMVGFCTRFWPSIQYMKDIIDSGILGKVKRFLFQYGASGGWAPVSNYFISKEFAGGGAFVINGSHYLDRMLWFFGSPTSYEFHDDAINGLEANALATFMFDNHFGSFDGAIRVSKTVILNAGSVIEFEKGTLIHRDWRSPALSLKINTSKNFSQFAVTSKRYNPEDRTDMYLLQLEEFISKCLQETNQNISDTNTSLEAIKITEELYRNREPIVCNWYKNEN